MTISFYLNDADTTLITTMYNVESNPFTVGDIISLNIEDIQFKPLGIKISDTKKSTLIKRNNDYKEMFNIKRIKILGRSMHLSFSILNETKLEIEYSCKLLHH